MVVAVDRVKSGREDQHVELVLDPVVGENTPWRNLDDRVFLGADQGYVVAIEGLVVVQVADRPFGVGIGWCQLSRGLRVFDDLSDLLTDE